MDAGAVAEARAANTMENARFKRNIQNVRINMKSDAVNASARVIITTFPALFFSFENLKNSPVLNAINARAISARNSVPVIIVCGIKFKQNGPIRIPVTIYAVTLGNFNFFVQSSPK